MNKNKYILNNIEKIKEILYEIREEEDLCNEGAMTEKTYKEIIELLIGIEKEIMLKEKK